MVGASVLEAAIRATDPEEFQPIIEGAGFDYAAVVAVAEHVAGGQVSRHQDLSDARRARLHQYGTALFTAGFVLALTAGKR